MFCALLKENNMTQSALAKKIGVSQQLVSSWCTGKSKPGIPSAYKLSQVLNVSIEDIVNCFKEQ